MNTTEIENALRSARILPVLTVQDAAHAYPLARVLTGAGLRVLEIALRTEHSWEAASRMREAAPQAVIGLGTVTTPAQLDQALEWGADFIVSPGLTPALMQAAAAAQAPLIPGVMTPGEVMQAVDAGFSLLKLFPAEPAGGVPLLKALAGPFPELRFCPTGGISAARAPAYLDLPNVVAVGGSWMAPPQSVATADWKHIGQLASAAAGIGA